MDSTRTEQAVDEWGAEDMDDEFEPSCDDIRLAWLASESHAGLNGSHDFEALWSDR
jgi:hypothetical protein